MHQTHHESLREASTGIVSDARNWGTLPATGTVPKLKYVFRGRRLHWLAGLTVLVIACYATVSYMCRTQVVPAVAPPGVVTPGGTVEVQGGDTAAVQGATKRPNAGGKGMAEAIYKMYTSVSN